MTIQDNLQKLGITLPKPAVPVANYVPFTISNNQIFISGQLPIENGKVKFVGKLGENIDIPTAKEAAKLCAINILANLNLALEGNLEKVEKCLKLGIFINATPDFTNHPEVANGASDLMVDIFGNKGKHARFAMGAGSLPLGAAVEIDAIFQIK